MSDIIKNNEEEVIFDIDEFGAKLKFIRVKSDLLSYKLRTEFYNKGHVFYSGTASVFYKNEWTDIIFTVIKLENFTSKKYEDITLIEDMLAADKLVAKYHNDEELINDIGEDWKGQVVGISVLIDGKPYRNNIGTYFYNSIPAVTSKEIVKSLAGITLGILFNMNTKN